VKFGVLFLPSGWKGTSEERVYLNTLGEAEAAEALGYDSVWLTEHRFTQYGRPGVSPLAAAIAARTRRIRIGTSVYVLPLHHPLEIAEDAAVIDILSGGRLDFGVGRGYQPEELLAFEVDFETSRERHNEALEVILQAWTTGKVEHEGRYWRIPPRDFRPLPLQKPHPPVWQPIVSPSSFDETVKLRKNAIIGSYMSPLSRFEQGYKAWFEALDRNGVARSELQVVSSLVVHVAETEAEARKNCEESYIWNARTFGGLIEPGRPEIKKYYADVSYDFIVQAGSLTGTPDHVREGIKQLQAYGLDYVVGFMNVADMDHQAVLRSMELFAKEVMPHFR